MLSRAYQHELTFVAFESLINCTPRTEATTGAAQTIDRIIDVCPPESQGQIRTQLAGMLRGVITQIGRAHV